METAGAVLLTLVSALYGKHYWQKSVRHCSSFGLVLILEGSSIGYSVGNAHRFFRGWYILTADWVFGLVNSIRGTLHHLFGPQWPQRRQRQQCCNVHKRSRLQREGFERHKGKLLDH